MHVCAPVMCVCARARAKSILTHTVICPIRPDLDTSRQRMNISLDGYGTNSGEHFLLEFCSVTAANGMCGVEDTGRISSSRSPGKQGADMEE